MGIRLTILYPPALSHARAPHAHNNTVKEMLGLYCLTALSLPGSPLPRQLPRRVVLGAAAAAALLPSWPLAPASASADPRSALLTAIASDKGVEAAIEALVPLDPSGGRAATSAELSGEWQLLWSANAAAFSPLLQLPAPIRPTSLQLLGDAAERAGFGEGRVAQLLQLPLSARLDLSSGVRPAADDASVLEIFPPFRFEVAIAGARRTLVDAGSDAEFRALNARTTEAQAAPRNRYQQRYLETTGRAGDLRISTVVSGDPVIVGSVFVHRRVR